MCMDVLTKPQKKSSEHHAGHRQRLKQRFLETMGQGMPDYELIELLLFYTNPRKDMKPLAKDLIKEFENIDNIIHADAASLAQVSGIGEAATILFKLIEVIQIRLKKAEITDKPIMNSWDKVIDYCQSMMGHKKTEAFHVIFLDQKNRLISDEVLQTGTVDQATIYPREVVKKALDLAASAIILVHNHPSGDPTPSQEDIRLTKHIQEAAELLSISVHDHLIICKSDFVSFRSLGLL